MRVLGIDPGSLIMGFGVVEEEANGLQALAWGALRTSAKQTLPERLKRIYAGLTESLRAWKPDAVFPQSSVVVEGKQAEQILRFMDVLDDYDDVRKTYANFDISDEVMAQLTS